MPGIFISYRRQDTSGYAGRLYERLSKHFGKRHVFMDIDTLQPGLDFGQALDQAVSSCEVLIALIGPTWLNAVDADGQRRLDNPDDFVRMEIAAALAREGVRVVPVLVGGASLPKAYALPADLKPLARRQSVEISDHRWDFDVARLIDRLEAVVPRAGRGVTMRRALTIGAPLVLVLIAVALAFSLMNDRNEAESASTPTSTSVRQTASAELSTSIPTEDATVAPSPTSESIATATAKAAFPVATTPTLLAAAGLTSEASYISPQFGYAIAWDGGWELDPDFRPPVRSDDGVDSLYLRSADTELSVIGSEPGDVEAVEQRIAILTGNEYLLATFGNRDHTVLQADHGAKSGYAVVLEWDGDEPALVHIIESYLLDDGETLVSAHLAAPYDRIESAHRLVSDTVALEGQAPFVLVEAGDVVGMVERATREPATPVPTEVATPVSTPAPATPVPASPASTPVPATPVATEAATPVRTSVSTPIAASPATPEVTPTVASTPELEAIGGIDPVLQSVGLVSERQYASPQYGHTVTWDDTWMLDVDYESPVISNSEERFDAIHITTAELYTPFVRVAAYDAATWGSMEEVVVRLSSDEWLEMAYPGAQKQVLLRKYGDNAGGMVVSRTTDTGNEYIAIFEAHLVNDGETLLLVTMTTTPSRVDSAYARTNETVWLNDAPPLSVFGLDEIVASVESSSEEPVALYESPRFGYTLSWDSHWVPSEEIDPAIGFSEETESEFVNLRVSDQGSALLMVSAVDTAGLIDAETAVASYASEQFLTASFGADHTLLAKDIRETSGGIVLEYTSGGGRFITIMESVLIEESGTMVTLIYTAPLAEVDDVVAYLESTRAASLRLNGEPLPPGFDSDVLSGLLADPEPATQQASLDDARGDVVAVSGWSAEDARRDPHP